MAVTRKDTVIIIDADNDTVPGPLNICGVRVVSIGASGNAQIRADQSASGAILYSSATLASGSVDSDTIEFRAQGGIYVNLSNAVVYLYLDVD